MDGVYNQDVRFGLLHSREYAVQVVLRKEIQPHFSYPKTLCPKLQLSLRFLAGHIEDLGKAAQLLTDLKHQGGLTNARRTANKDKRTLHRTSAQDPVQLIQTGPETDLLGNGHF